MHILDYDEFNIYTTPNDVENYIEHLISEGIKIKEELYGKCISHFGIELKHIIDDLFLYFEE
jgi:hypothetical protein